MKFLLLFFLVFTYFVFYIGNETYKFGNNLAVQRTVSSLHNISSSKESGLLEYLDGKRDLTASFASDSFMQTAVVQLSSSINSTSTASSSILDSNQLQVFLQQNKLPIDSDIYSISVFTVLGEFLASTLDSNPLITIPDQSFFAQGSTKTVIEDAILLPSLNKAVFTVGAPIRTDSDEVVGILAIQYTMDSIHEFFTSEADNASEGFPIRAYLVNQDGLILTKPLDVESFTPLTMDVSKKLPVKSCLNGGEEINTNWVNHLDTPVLGSSQCVTIDDGVEWILIAEQDAAAVQYTLTPFRNTFLIGLGLLLIMSIMNIGGIIYLFVKDRKNKVDVDGDGGAVVTA